MSDFIETWRTSESSPYLDLTFSWVGYADGLQGRWIMGTPEPPVAR